MDSLSSWIAVFWIILLFAATNASINSFKRESGKQFYYYYMLSSPQAIVFSKLIFNVILLNLVAVISFGLFTFLFENPIENTSLFLLVLFLGSSAIAATLTLVSAIASRTNNNSAITAILAFPILLPSILTAIKASVLCGIGLGWEDVQAYLITLAMLNIIIGGLSYVLFPYLWRS